MTFFMLIYFLEVKNDGTSDVAIQKSSSCIIYNVYLRRFNKCISSVSYTSNYEVRFPVKSQKINKILAKLVLISKDVHTVDGQQK